MTLSPIELLIFRILSRSYRGTNNEHERVAREIAKEITAQGKSHRPMYEHYYTDLRDDLYRIDREVAEGEGKG